MPLGPAAGLIEQSPSWGVDSERTRRHPRLLILYGAAKLLVSGREYGPIPLATGPHGRCR